MMFDDDTVRSLSERGFSAEHSAEERFSEDQCPRVNPGGPLAGGSVR